MGSFKLALYFSFFLFNVFANPVALKAKQAIDYVRYLSTDGKNSYYQNKNGELFYSSFYNTKNILKKNPLDMFYVLVEQGHSLIEYIPNYHSIALHEANHELYLGKIGEEHSLIAKGLSPVLSPLFERLAYIDPLTNELIIYDISFKKISKKILLKASNLRSRQMDIHFISRNDVIYSDYNEKNEKFYVYLSLLDNSRKLVFKASSSQYNLEACIIGKKIIVGQFPINNLNLGTEIISIDLYNNKNFSSFKQIYSSALPDLGSMVCKGNLIYFLKAFSKNLTLQTRELDAVELESQEKSLKRLSNLNNLTTLFSMDKLVLTYHKGEYLILSGSQILDDKIEKERK